MIMVMVIKCIQITGHPKLHKDDSLYEIVNNNMYTCS